MWVDIWNLGGTKKKDRKTILREEREKKQEEKGKTVEIRKTIKEGSLREVTVQIGLERIDMQEGVTVEALLDSGVI